MLKDFYLYSVNKLKETYGNPISLIINVLILNWWINSNGVIIGTAGYLLMELAVLMVYYYLYITDFYNF
jgi:hypothetical protein